MSSEASSTRQRNIERSLDQAQRAVDDLRMVLGSPPPEFRLAASVVKESDVRDVIRARARRSELFGENLFSDPAWDILLELFACALVKRRVGVVQLSKAANVSLSTAIRWVGELKKAGLIDREVDELGGRRARMTLSPRAYAAMNRHFLEYPSRPSGADGPADEPG